MPPLLIQKPAPKAPKHMRTPSQVRGGSGEDEEDEGAVGIKEKPLFLDDEDATMQSGDEDMDTTGSADMTAAAVPERRGSCS